MKIAVASMGNIVAGHFGHCENFNIYDVVDNKIVSASSVPNPGHKPGFLPNYLADLGVNIIMSGGMGGGAIEIFNERNVEVVTGAEGLAEECVTRYLNGDLKSSGAVCHEHEHAHECGH
jgi:predicted Fe-Mo cluster-binding NifX family protein